MAVSEKSAWKRAEAAGMDLSLVEANLRLGMLERLRQHDVALNRVTKMRATVKRQIEKRTLRNDRKEVE